MMTEKDQVGIFHIPVGGRPIQQRAFREKDIGITSRASAGLQGGPILERRSATLPYVGRLRSLLHPDGENPRAKER